MLVVVSPAAADAGPPPGFTLEPIISARAAWIAQKPVSIYCASTDASWKAYVATLPVQPTATPHGYTPQFGDTTSYLAPDVCAPINARLHKRAVNLVTLGAALDVLTVESLHLRGDISDGQTACDAMRLLGRFVIAEWGFRNHTVALGTLLRGARTYLAGQPPAYHDAGC
jgi:hypothetical protein